MFYDVDENLPFLARKFGIFAALHITPSNKDIIIQTLTEYGVDISKLVFDNPYIPNAGITFDANFHIYPTIQRKSGISSIHILYNTLLIDGDTKPTYSKTWYIESINNMKMFEFVNQTDSISTVQYRDKYIVTLEFVKFAVIQPYLHKFMDIHVIDKLSGKLYFVRRYQDQIINIGIYDDANFHYHFIPLTNMIK